MTLACTIYKLYCIDLILNECLDYATTTSIVNKSTGRALELLI